MGTTGTAAHFFPDDVNPLAIGACTMALGGALLFFVSFRGSVAAIREPAARRWLLIGALGVVVYPLAFYTSMDLAGVAIGNVVSLGTGPVFAALLEWLWERHGLDLRWALCTAVAVGGILLLAVGRDGDAGPDIPLGIALGVLAGLSYALYTYASSRAIRTGQPARAVMGGMFGLGAVPLAVVLVLLGAPLLQSPQTVGIAAYLGDRTDVHRVSPVRHRHADAAQLDRHDHHPARAGGRHRAGRDRRGRAPGAHRMGRTGCDSVGGDCPRYGSSPSHSP